MSILRSHVPITNLIVIPVCVLRKGLACIVCTFLLINICFGQTLDEIENPHSISRSQENDLVTALYDSTYKQLVYEIVGESCKTSMIVYAEGNTNKGGISHRTTCAWPLTNNLFQYQKLLERMFNDITYHYLIDSVTWISWGRLGENATEMSLRLAIESNQSPVWDAKRGKVKTGYINNFVKKLSNEKEIYKELKELFASYEIEIKVSSIEKVLISRADRLDYFEELKKIGIRASDILPFDCQTWFSLERKGNK